jgi:hypothetical protein
VLLNAGPPIPSGPQVAETPELSTAVPPDGDAAEDATPPAPASRLVSTDAYRRALRDAIERAQRNLERRLELFEDHSTWENAWVVTSPHYTVRNTTSRYFGVRTAEQLETDLAAFRETLLSDWTPSGTFHVYVFPTLEDYRAYSSENGLDHSAFYGSYYPRTVPELPVVTYQYPNRTQLQMWITHTAFHQFLDCAYDRSLPTWMGEGLASYFALRPNYRWAAGEYHRHVERGTLIPLPELLATPLSGYTDRPGQRVLQLGLFFVFLFEHYEPTRTLRRGGEVWHAPLSEYLDALLTADDFEYHPLHRMMTEGLDAVAMDFAAFEFPR